MTSIPSMGNNEIIRPCFFFAGRLSIEKGFDRIMRFGEFLLESPNNGCLHICGDGDMKASLLSKLSDKKGFLDISFGYQGKQMEESFLKKKYTVIYHGKVDKYQLFKIIGMCNYCLMPSRFLETFGLSALESIERGVPVIGTSKGGLQQFLLSHHCVSDVANDINTTRNFLAKCNEVISTFSYEYWKSESAAVKNISDRYSRNVWHMTFLSAFNSKNEENKLFANGPSRVLIISDFSAPIGGIESHIASLKGLLHSIQFSSRTLFAISGNSRISRIFSFFLAHINIFYALRLYFVLISYKPDIIWLHSVNRAIGPLGLYPLRFSQSPVIATYHDLGFTTPFPSKVYHESDVPEFNMKSFYFAGYKASGYLGGIASIIKYFFLILQKTHFRRVKIHFVPSEFLAKYVTYQFGEDQKVVVLPHCKDSEL